VLTDGGDAERGPSGMGEEGGRMRLYLLDLPESMPAQILAIAITAPDSEFDRVMEEAAPIVDSVEFHSVTRDP
jgi:hypothetical protein